MSEQFTFPFLIPDHDHKWEQDLHNPNMLICRGCNSVKQFSFVTDVEEQKKMIEALRNNNYKS